MKKKPAPGVTTAFFLIIAGIFATVLISDPPAAEGPLRQIWLITFLTATVSFLFSLLTGDYSWTDRLWSVSPAAYAVIYTAAGNFSGPSLLAGILIVAWGSRLTGNFARRGGYSGSEDYRWSILHDRISHPLLWQLFNVLFIALYQQVLFVLFTLPLNVLLAAPPSTMSPAAAAAAVAAGLFLVLETAADEQQYRFQQSKYGFMPKNDAWEADYRRGFRTTGLFRLCRHPNYLGELGFWWSIYFIPAAAAGTLLNYSIIGALLLTLLFAGSTTFTEQISSSRYPEYAAYQSRVWPIIPRPWPRHQEADPARQSTV